MPMHMHMHMIKHMICTRDALYIHMINFNMIKHYTDQAHVNALNCVMS